MKIGLIGRFNYPCSIENFYSRGLKNLGHDVIVAPPFQLVRDDTIDLIIVVKWIDIHSLLRLKQAKCPTALIFTDLTSRFKEYYDAINNYFDFVFLVHDETKLIDNQRVFYLPVGYCPQEHMPLPVKKDIDALFIGTCHENREFLKSIPTIQRFGNGWGDTHDVYGDDYRLLCSRARIIVNNHYPGDTTNMRDYEAPNFYTLVLTDKTPFIDGVDCVVYTGKKDLEEKIQYFIYHFEKRIQIALHGLNTIKKGKFKYRDRMEEMLNIIAR